jgi:hypothetical protein
MSKMMKGHIKVCRKGGASRRYWTKWWKWTIKWLRRYKAMKKSMKKKLAGKKKRRVFRMKVFLNISRNLHQIFRELCVDLLSHAEHQSVFISKDACLLMTTDV